MRFNVGAFLKTAAAVATGEIKGQLQAEQLIQQRGQQELENQYRQFQAGQNAEQEARNAQLRGVEFVSGLAAKAISPGERGGFLSETAAEAQRVLNAPRRFGPDAARMIGAPGYAFPQVAPPPSLAPGAVPGAGPPPPLPSADRPLPTEAMPPPGAPQGAPPAGPPPAVGYSQPGAAGPAPQPTGPTLPRGGAEGSVVALRAAQAAGFPGAGQYADALGLVESVKASAGQSAAGLATGGGAGGGGAAPPPPVPGVGPAGAPSPGPVPQAKGPSGLPPGYDIADDVPTSVAARPKKAPFVSPYSGKSYSVAEVDPAVAKRLFAQFNQLAGRLRDAVPAIETDPNFVLAIQGAPTLEPETPEELQSLGVALRHLIVAQAGSGVSAGNLALRAEAARGQKLTQFLRIVGQSGLGAWTPAAMRNLMEQMGIGQYFAGVPDNQLAGALTGARADKVVAAFFKDMKANATLPPEAQKSMVDYLRGVAALRGPNAPKIAVPARWILQISPLEQARLNRVTRALDLRGDANDTARANMEIRRQSALKSTVKAGRQLTANANLAAIRVRMKREEVALSGLLGTNSDDKQAMLRRLSEYEEKYPRYDVDPATLPVLRTDKLFRQVWRQQKKLDAEIRAFHQTMEALGGIAGPEEGESASPAAGAGGGGYRDAGAGRAQPAQAPPSAARPARRSGTPSAALHARWIAHVMKRYPNMTRAKAEVAWKKAAAVGARQ